MPRANSLTPVAAAVAVALANLTAVDTADAYLLPQSIIRWEWDGETGYGLADRCGLSSYFETLEVTP